MELYHAFVAGRHPHDRIDFFVVERRPPDMLRDILTHFGLHRIRAMLRNGDVSREDAEAMVIVASKLLTLNEVQGLQQYVEIAMGLPASYFQAEVIVPPMTPDILERPGLRLALNAYHQDGLFLALWANDYYPLPTKIGGFVAQEAQDVLQKRAQQLDEQFTEFVRGADTLDDLLGPENPG